MHRVVSSAFVTLLLMLLVIPAQAQDLTGTWVMTYTQPARGGGGEAREVTQEFTFAPAEDGTMAGTTMMAMRGGRGGAGGGGTPPAPQEVALSDIKFEDGKLTFAITQIMGERTMSTAFAATVAGKVMEGTMTRAAGGRGGGGTPTPTPFKATKKEG
jgi:hypothetical protein